MQCYQRQQGKYVLDRKSGKREAYRELLAKTVQQLWEHVAMPFDDATRVDSTVRALMQLLMPDVTKPTLAPKTVATRAQKMVEEQKEIKREQRRNAMEKATEHARSRAAYAAINKPSVRLQTSILEL